MDDKPWIRVSAFFPPSGANVESWSALHVGIGAALFYGVGCDTERGSTWITFTIDDSGNAVTPVPEDRKLTAYYVTSMDIRDPF